MKNLFLSMAVTAAFLSTAAKAEVTNCTEITSVPTVITAQGIYCLKHDLSSSLASGNMIDIQANNVTIDLNGFKLGGLGAGPGTVVNGIHAVDRKNITVRNGSIRGFFNGVLLEGSSFDDVVEDLFLDGNRSIGISVFGGTGHIIRRNRVMNTSNSASTEATGILLELATNSLITDNVVVGTTEPVHSVGIWVAIAQRIEVRNNSVLDTGGTQNKYGIEVDASTTVSVINNRIINAPGTGTGGIFNVNFTLGLSCIDNTVTGFAVAMNNCAFLDGNHSF